MHEMSLCESVVRAIEEQAVARQYTRVLRVCLEIGRLSGVDPQALRFGFDVVTRNTLADGALLEIVHAPGKAWCLQCSDTVDVEQRYTGCPKCGSYQIQVTSGEEMNIKELEVE